MILSGLSKVSAAVPVIALIAVVVSIAYFDYTGYMPSAVADTGSQGSASYMEAGGESGGTASSDILGDTPETSGAMASGPVTHSVDISGFSYTPSSLTVNAGDTVVWTNHDTVGHTVTSDQGTELHSGVMAAGQAYSHTFDTPGTYTYHCTIHPYMKGTVTVLG